MATEATGMPEPASALHRGGNHRRIDADRAGCAAASRPSPARMWSARGRRALAQSRRTRSGVSSPASVVRSMQRIALTSHAACHSFLTVRLVVSVAARRSAAGVLTAIPSNQSACSGTPGLRRAFDPDGGGFSEATLIIGASLHRVGASGRGIGSGHRVGASGRGIRSGHQVGAAGRADHGSDASECPD